MRARRSRESLVTWLIVGPWAIVLAFPFYWMLITTFKRTSDLLTRANNPFIFNEPPTLENIRILFDDTLYLRWLLNTGFVAVVVVAITLVLALPAGYALLPVGSFQNQIEANQRLAVIIPIVILVDLLIIYLNFRNLPLTLIIFSQIPIAIFGGMIGLGLWGIEMNTAIWVGLIALIGIAEDDGVVIATYMEQLFNRRPMRTVVDLREATVEAGRRRIRPCLMTAFTTFAALLPVMTATGRGADVARAMALPVFFGMFIELLSLFVVPVLYCGYKENQIESLL